MPRPVLRNKNSLGCENMGVGHRDDSTLDDARLAIELVAHPVRRSQKTTPQVETGRTRDDLDARRAESRPTVNRESEREPVRTVDDRLLLGGPAGDLVRKTVVDASEVCPGIVRSIVANEGRRTPRRDVTVRQCEQPVSYTHLRAHETGRNLVCRL